MTIQGRAESSERTMQSTTIRKKLTSYMPYDATVSCVWKSIRASTKTVGICLGLNVPRWRLVLLWHQKVSSASGMRIRVPTLAYAILTSGTSPNNLSWNAPSSEYWQRICFWLEADTKLASQAWLIKVICKGRTMHSCFLHLYFELYLSRQELV